MTAGEEVSRLQNKLLTAEKSSVERICDIRNQGNKIWMVRTDYKIGHAFRILEIHK